MPPAIARTSITWIPFDPTYAALTLTALLWSSNFVIGRALNEAITPATLNFLRWALALLVLLPFTLVELRRHRAALLQTGSWSRCSDSPASPASRRCAYVALTQTTALNAILLLSLAPLAIVALSWLALGERISRVQAAGLVTSLGGAAVLILHGEIEALAELRFNAGDLWMLVAVGLWAIYSVLLRSKPAQVPPLALHTASVGAGALWMLPLFGWEAARGGGLPTDLTVWLAIGFVAVFSSAIAHAMWVRGVATIGANRASVFIHLMPLFGALLAITFLGEQLATYHAVGAALVLTGVVLTSRK
jgi:drug/metabolite transporter (DMT)-like permease